MYYIGFLLVILLSLGVMAYIIVSKFPQLRSFDTNNLPQERESRKKKELIDKRIDEKGEKLKAKIEIYLRPIFKVWGQLQLRFRIYVGKIKRMMHHEEELKRGENVENIEEENNNLPVTENLIQKENHLDKERKEDKKIFEEKENKFDKVPSLLQEAEKNFQAGEYEKAEEKFITAIKLDQKNPVAYRGLADTYLALNSLEEARQTYKFVLQLEPDDDSVMVKMAEIADSQGDVEEAIEYYQKAVVVNDSLAPRFYHLARLLHQINQDETAKESALQAVELDPNNVEYLDLLLQIAIMLSNKDLAQEIYAELRSLEPENNKLDSYKVKIEAMIIEK